MRARLPLLSVSLLGSSAPQASAFSSYLDMLGQMYYSKLPNENGSLSLAKEMPTAASNIVIDDPSTSSDRMPMVRDAAAAMDNKGNYQIPADARRTVPMAADSVDVPPIAESASTSSSSTTTPPVMLQDSDYLGILNTLQDTTAPLDTTPTSFPDSSTPTDTTALPNALSATPSLASPSITAFGGPWGGSDRTPSLTIPVVTVPRPPVESAELQQLRTEMEAVRADLERLRRLAQDLDETPQPTAVTNDANPSASSTEPPSIDEGATSISASAELFATPAATKPTPADVEVESPLSAATTPTIETQDSSSTSLGATAADLESPAETEAITSIPSAVDPEFSASSSILVEPVPSSPAPLDSKSPLPSLEDPKTRVAARSEPTDQALPPLETEVARESLATAKASVTEPVKASNVAKIPASQSVTQGLVDSATSPVLLESVLPLPSGGGRRERRRNRNKVKAAASASADLPVELVESVASTPQTSVKLEPRDSPSTSTSQSPLDVDYSFALSDDAPKPVASTVKRDYTGFGVKPKAPEPSASTPVDLPSIARKVDKTETIATVQPVKPMSLASVSAVVSSADVPDQFVVDSPAGPAEGATDLPSLNSLSEQATSAASSTEKDSSSSARATSTATSDAGRTSSTTNPKQKNYSGFGVKPKAPSEPLRGKAVAPDVMVQSNTAETSVQSLMDAAAAMSMTTATTNPKTGKRDYSGFGVKRKARELPTRETIISNVSAEDATSVPVEAEAATTESTIGAVDQPKSDRIVPSLSTVELNLVGNSGTAPATVKKDYSGFGIKPRAPKATQPKAATSSATSSAKSDVSLVVPGAPDELSSTVSTLAKKSYSGFGVSPETRAENAQKSNVAKTTRDTKTPSMEARSEGAQSPLTELLMKFAATEAGDESVKKNYSGFGVKHEAPTSKSDALALGGEVSIEARQKTVESKDSLQTLATNDVGSPTPVRKDSSALGVNIKGPELAIPPSLLDPSPAMASSIASSDSSSAPATENSSNSTTEELSPVKGGYTGFGVKPKTPGGFGSANVNPPVSSSQQSTQVSAKGMSTSPSKLTVASTDVTESIPPALSVKGDSKIADAEPPLSSAGDVDLLSEVANVGRTTKSSNNELSVKSASVVSQSTPESMIGRVSEDIESQTAPTEASQEATTIKTTSDTEASDAVQHAVSPDTSPYVEPTLEVAASTMDEVLELMAVAQSFLDRNKFDEAEESYSNALILLRSLENSDAESRALEQTSESTEEGTAGASKSGMKGRPSGSSLTEVIRQTSELVSREKSMGYVVRQSTNGKTELQVSYLPKPPPSPSLLQFEQLCSLSSSDGLEPALSLNCAEDVDSYTIASNPSPTEPKGEQLPPRPFFLNFESAVDDAVSETMEPVRVGLEASNYVLSTEQNWFQSAFGGLQLDKDWIQKAVSTVQNLLEDASSTLQSLPKLRDPPPFELGESNEPALYTKGMTERIIKRTPVEGQATGAGGASTWESFQRVERNWKTLRESNSKAKMDVPEFVTMDGAKGNPKCWQKLSAQKNMELDYDVVVCGGTLGIFFATALMLKGHRVAVLEAGKLRGREQEWNISMDELLELVKLGVLTQDDVDAVVTTEFPGCRSGFKNMEATPLQGGYFDNGIGFECYTADVLNLGIAPAILIDRTAARFKELGGVLLEETRLHGVVVSESIGSAVDLGPDVEPVTAQLVLDCMGNASPISRQQRRGVKPDGVCAVVGSCASGFDNETNALGDIIYTNSVIQDKGENGMLQYFWEAFPVGIGRNGMEPGSSTTKTTYMFTYMDANEKRPSLETLMEDYWRMLPKYQPSITNPETDLDVKRVLFAYFPTYRDSPLKPQWSRILAVGDASGIQSPLSFGGFGALTRHLDRISTALSEALENRCLSKDDLGEINQYLPNLSASWMFQKAMSVRIGQKVHPTFVNRLLATNFEVMDSMGTRTIKPFLQDVVRFDGLVGSLARSFVADPAFMPEIVSHVGIPTLVEWIGHVGMMGAYGLLDSVASPLVKAALASVVDDPRTQFQWRRRMEAWKYGSGQDYVLPQDTNS